MFVEARTRDYDVIAAELKKLSSGTKRHRGAIARLRRRFREATEIDFFNSPMRSRLETCLRAPNKSRAFPIITSRGREWNTAIGPGLPDLGRESIVFHQHG